MFKIKFRQIFNVDKFIALIEESQRSVLWRLSDDTVCNLKCDIFARCIMERRISRGDGAEILLSDAEDYFQFVHFMMGDC